MMKRFNINGVCSSELHYMVDTTEKIEQIADMVNQGDYFTINRARQYGKTTTLALLERSLRDRYTVIRISFEGYGDMVFGNQDIFIGEFIEDLSHRLKYQGVADEIISDWTAPRFPVSFKSLSRKITELCERADKPVVLMIDEVDKTSNNQLFLDFLGMLRSKYLERTVSGEGTFQSVILAGVYDIKNIKLKLRPGEQQIYNSPWNIAASFDVDMSFSADQISTMLVKYEADHHGNKQSLFQGMNISEISNEIYRYTSGYPYLVSNVCKIIDEQLSCDWSLDGVHKAIGILLTEHNTLFDDISKNLENYPDFMALVERILLRGETIPYISTNPEISLGVMFGIFAKGMSRVEISNQIFETYIYNYLIIREITKTSMKLPERSQYIENGKLNMKYMLTRFQALMKSEYRSSDDDFIEKQGRLLFLCFLKPIINGMGHYAVEAQTRENTRMDIVVFYGGEEFIIELKIWHGDRMNTQAREQLREYLNSRGQSKGYLVSFSFNESKEYTSGWTKIGDKDIFEIIV